MKNSNFNFRAEELSPFGKFVEASFITDQEAFSAFSPEYGDNFATTFNSKLKAVKEVVAPETVTSQMKNATEQLHIAEDMLGNHLSHLERYCEMAGSDLPVKVGDLRIPGLRKSIRSRDAEGIAKGARNLQQVLKPCRPVLELKGYTLEQQAELGTLIETIEKANLEQDQLLNQRRRMVEENMEQLNEFWAMLVDIMKTGKLIHRDNQVRKAEYTQSHLLKRIRIVRENKEGSEG